MRAVEREDVIHVLGEALLGDFEQRGVRAEERQEPVHLSPCGMPETSWPSQSTRETHLQPAGAALATSPERRGSSCGLAGLERLYNSQSGSLPTFRVARDGAICGQVEFRQLPGLAQLDRQRPPNNMNRILASLLRHPPQFLE